MGENFKHLQDLKEIRNLMERSSKFVSLSGLSGVIAGLIALAGTFVGYLRIRNYWELMDNSRFTDYSSFIRATIPTTLGWSPLVFDLVLIAIIIFVSSVSISIYLTVKSAKKNNQSIWDKTTQTLLINTLIPLVVGGILCLLLIKQQLFGLVAPMTLIFYGLALVNASKYTLHDIKYLGLIQVTLGLINASSIGYGLYFWALGFGFFHIFYGVIMYLKYERNK